MLNLLIIIRNGLTVDPQYRRIGPCRDVLALIARGEAPSIRGAWRGAAPGRLEVEAQALKAAALSSDGGGMSLSAIKRRQGRWEASDGILVPADAIKAAKADRLASGDQGAAYSLAQSWQQNLTRDLQESGLVVCEDGEAFTVVVVES